MTDTVESVLAEMRAWCITTTTGYAGQDELRDWADRLAAAHAREESAWSKLMTGELDKRRAAEARAEAAEADARRYRWLRASTTPGYLHFPNGEVADGLALGALDAAIDAHLSGKDGEGA